MEGKEGKIEISKDGRKGGKEKGREKEGKEGRTE